MFKSTSIVPANIAKLLAVDSWLRATRTRRSVGFGELLLVRIGTTKHLFPALRFVTQANSMIFAEHEVIRIFERCFTTTSIIGTGAELLSGDYLPS